MITVAANERTTIAETRLRATRFRPQTCEGRCLALTGVSVVLLALQMPIASWLFGESGILAAGISCVSCLLPGCLLFVLASRCESAVDQVNCVLLGTLVRGGFCVVGAVVMEGLLHISRENYLIWLTVFYLVLLGCETALLLQWETPRVRRAGKLPAGAARG